MNETENRALRAATRVLDWAATAEHAWNPPPFHVEGMHPRAEQLILDGIDDAVSSASVSPLGVVIQGEGGAGKTHLLGWTRAQVSGEGGYFFLVDFSAGTDFWQQTTASIVEDLGRSDAGPGGPAQALRALRALEVIAGIEHETTPISRKYLDALVEGLVSWDRKLIRCRDTIRALALYAAADGPALDVGHDYLMSADESEDGIRQAWGMSRATRTRHDIAVELSMLLALTGPTVIAVDQIDPVLQGPRRAGQSGEAEADLVDEVAGGLMALRHTMSRTLCVVACLPTSWSLVKERAVGTAKDRFRTSHILDTISNRATAQAMIERRFAEAYAGFEAPSPTWPVAPEAFNGAVGLTPRTLLRRISGHIEACRISGEVSILRTLDPAPSVAEAAMTSERVPEGVLAQLDERFAALVAEADIADAFDPDLEDEVVPPLLSAGLNAWIMEQGEVGRAYSVDPPLGRRPVIHARLRQALDLESEEQQHWTFRMIGARHHLAALKRLNDGMETSGSGMFVVLRNHAWSDGPTTQARLAELQERGGRTLVIREGDLRVFEALLQMTAEGSEQFEEWLRARRPAGATELLRSVLAQPEERTAPAIPAPPSGTRLPLGTRLDTGAALELNLASLNRHVAVFAGSGSGKTVFLRRLIEECALHGVSSIVLDPNNDLARLGDPWPEQPSGWAVEDAAKASRYLADTEVVIWTPGRTRGRPLSFQPLPDFSAVLDDRDELTSVISVAVEALAPRAGVAGASAKARKGTAVLRQALGHFARSGGGDFTAFLGLLAALPFEASQIERADQIAADLGQLLIAATINDPLFAGAGEPADPAQLLTPSIGKRARISVISFIGLSDDAKPGFVSQLQMALFSWIKRNPARGGPLCGLYVMDEAQALVPASPKTEALASTLTLASQARKYGLGLVFATQAPRALHNQIAGNATTQFIGRMNSPTQIDVVQSLARARGGRADRVGRLETGQFYAAGDGLSEVLVRTPLCLSYHPADPLTEQEILGRARRGL